MTLLINIIGDIVASCSQAVVHIQIRFIAYFQVFQNDALFNFEEGSYD